jgi:hypothetical protein
MAIDPYQYIFEASGASQDKNLIKEMDRKKFILGRLSGANDEEILGINKKETLMEEESRSWWKKTLEGVEDWAVGEDADWGTYWERGLGKSNINLWLQSREAQGKKRFSGGIDWRKAYAPEPEDTGALERVFESLVALGADTPTFVAGAVPAALVTGGSPLASGFAAGFVNDSIKGMFLGALQRGDVDTFGEYWDQFLKHGIEEGLKGGLIAGGMTVAPNVLPILKLPVNKFTVAGSRWSALTGIGAAVEGELPTKETMVNNAILLGAFGFFDPKARMMLENSAVKNKGNPLEILKDTLDDNLMKEEAGSKNIKTFSKDRKIVEAEVRNLKEELAELNKLEQDALPTVIKSKSAEIKKVESEIKTLEKNILESTTESAKKLNETQLEIRRQDLKDLVEDTGRFIESKDVAAFKKEQATRSKEQLAELEKQQSNIMIELNELKQKKNKNEFYDEKRLKKLNKDAKDIKQQISNTSKLVNKEKRIKQIEKELENNGQYIERTYDKNKEFGKHENADVNFILGKTEIGKIKLDTKDIQLSKSAIVTSLLDRLYPIKEAVQQARDKGIAMSSFDFYQKSRIQMGNIGKGFHFIKKGTFDYNTLKINGKSFMEIFKDVIDTPRKYEEFTAYAIAKRAMEKYNQGISTVYSLTKSDRAKLNNVIKNYNKQYSQAFKEMNEYQQRVLTYLQDAGILSPELYRTILDLNRDYVPLNKVLDLSLTTAAKKTDTGLGTLVRNPLKEMKGTTKELAAADPIETMLLNTLHFVQIAEKNAVNKGFIELALKYQQSKNISKSEKIGSFFDEVKEVKSLKSTKLTPKEIDALFDKKTKISESAKDGLTILRKQDGWLKENQIAFYEKGKLKIYEVPQEIATSLKDVSKYQAELFYRMAAIPTRLLRAGATLDPEFIAKNFGRDTFFAAAFSQNNFIPFISSMRGMFRLLKDKVKGDALFADYMKSGAMQSTMISFDRRYFRSGEMLNELTGRKLHNYINPKNWLEGLRAISEVFENASRLEDFRMTVKRLEKENLKKPDAEKLTPREILESAGFEARELTIDFRKMGTDMVGLNMLNAFFNARVQGALKLKEGLFDPKRRKKVISQSVMWITTPTILLWYKNKDSEVYKNLPQWQKDLNWIIITNEGTPDQVVWRIPKPFEIGWLFGTFPEKMLDWAYNKDKDLFPDVKEFLGDYGMSFLPIPEFIRPFMEDSQNRSFFFDRPIVPYSLERVLPEYQTTEYTSPTATLIAQAAAKLRNTLGWEELVGPSLDSPLKVQNYITSWTGGLGKYVLDVLDYSFKKAGISKPPVKPWSDNWVQNLSEIPMVGAFVVRNPSASAEPIQKFWELYKPVATNQATFDMLMGDNKVQEAIKLTGGFDSDMFLLLETAPMLKDLGDVIDLIYQNDEISPNDKRQLIDQFYMNMIDITNNALKTIEE